MPFELHFLMLSVILGLVHLVIAVLAFVSQHGLSYAMSPRDESRTMNVVGARIERSFRNFLETFAFFAVAVLIAQSLGIHNQKTALGVELYFWARLVYIPTYAFGIRGLRTLIWAVSIAGILLVLCGACHPV